MPCAAFSRTEWGVRLPKILVQETFCRAWEKRDRYRERGSQKAYLFTLADRLAIDWLRRERRGRWLNWSVVTDEAVAPDEPDRIVAEEAATSVRRSLEKLNEAQRRVLLLRYFGGLTFEEIAGTLGCPLGTALSHARRGLEAMRQLMAEERS